jgi:hypothetical protein
MNVEIGAEAALFPEKEYINVIAVAVFSSDLSFTGRERFFVLLLFQPEFKQKVWTLTENFSAQKLTFRP